MYLIEFRTLYTEKNIRLNLQNILETHDKILNRRTFSE